MPDLYLKYVVYLRFLMKYMRPNTPQQHNLICSYFASSWHSCCLILWPLHDVPLLSYYDPSWHSDCLILWPLMMFRLSCVMTPSWHSNCLVFMAFCSSCMNFSMLKMCLCCVWFKTLHYFMLKIFIKLFRFRICFIIIAFQSNLKNWEELLNRIHIRWIERQKNQTNISIDTGVVNNLIWSVTVCFLI